MFRFLGDLIIYPFDKDKKNNKFGQFIKLLLKDYPAFLRIKPSFKKILVFPFLVIYHIFKRKTS